MHSLYYGPERAFDGNIHRYESAALTTRDPYPKFLDWVGVRYKLDAEYSDIYGFRIYLWGRWVHYGTDLSIWVSPSPVRGHLLMLAQAWPLCANCGACACCMRTNCTGSTGSALRSSIYIGTRYIYTYLHYLHTNLHILKANMWCVCRYSPVAAYAWTTPR